ncbi:hypothetical protein E4T48_08151 [Aureobasidium sp. EXF-10727]|nr:hypothetical protein E4T48_08151 [Aureobasidium sp. EXF-10727]
MILGKKADDFFVAVKQHLDNIKPGRLDSSLDAFQQAATTLVDLSGDLKGQDLAHLIYNAKATLLFTQIYIVLAIVVGALLIRRLGAFIHHVRKSLRNLSDVTEVQKNIHYQTHFAGAVHRFIEYQHVLHDKEYLNDPQDAVYFVYHPGNDWHASFHTENVSGKGVEGVYDNLPKLIEQLRTLRQNPEFSAVIYILLPSAHRYDFTVDLRSDTALLPLKFRGQRDYSGKALCRGHIRGMPLGVDLKDVDSSPKKPAPYWPFVWPFFGLMAVLIAAIATTEYIEN